MAPFFRLFCDATVSLSRLMTEMRQVASERVVDEAMILCKVLLVIWY